MSAPPTLDDVVTDVELADRLACPVKDIKRAWREGRLRGTKLSTGLRFREPAIKAWLEAEEARWHASNTGSRGSDASGEDQAGTSTTTMPRLSESEELALTRTIANELKRPSATSSSAVLELPRRGRQSHRSDTRS